MEDCHSNFHALMGDEKSAKVTSPSTEEIVRNLLNRNVTKQTLDRCKWELIAADRLKSLESELLQKTQELERNMEWHKESVETATNNMLEFSNQSVRLADELVAMTKRAEQLEMERDAYMEECDSGRTKGYNEGYSDGYQDGTKGI